MVLRATRDHGALGDRSLSLVGQRGDMCLRALEPALPAWLPNNEEESAETFGGQWMHIKDAARQDQNGYVSHEGHAEDVTISAGYRTPPVEDDRRASSSLPYQEARCRRFIGHRRNVVKPFIALAAGHELTDENIRLVRDCQSA